MICRPEQRRRRAHVVCDESQRPAGPETDLLPQGAELFGQRTPVISLGSCGLVGVPKAAHVGNKDGVTSLREKWHHLVPRIAGSEKAVPKQHRRTVGVTPQPIMKGDAAHQGGCAFKVRDCLYRSSHFLTPSIRRDWGPG